jgi:hypothetical protein
VALAAEESRWSRKIDGTDVFANTSAKVKAMCPLPWLAQGQLERSVEPDS